MAAKKLIHCLLLWAGAGERGQLLYKGGCGSTGIKTVDPQFSALFPSLFQ